MCSRFNPERSLPRTRLARSNATVCELTDSCLFAKFADRNFLENSDPYLLWKKSRREQISPASGVLDYFGAGAGFGTAAGAGFEAAGAEFPEQAPARQLAHLHLHKLSPACLLSLPPVCHASRIPVHRRQRPTRRSLLFYYRHSWLEHRAIYFGIPCLQVFQAKVQFSAFAGHAGLFGVRYGS